MTNKPKAIGTRGETRVVKFMEEHGIKAERRALHGSQDLGDVILPGKGVVLEIKAGQQTKGYGRKLKATWLSQAKVEGENSGMGAYLVIAVHGRSVKDYEVWDVSGRSFWYLDEFAAWLGK